MSPYVLLFFSPPPQKKGRNRGLRKRERTVQTTMVALVIHQNLALVETSNGNPSDSIFDKMVVTFLFVLHVCLIPFLYVCIPCDIVTLYFKIEKAI